MSCYGTSDNKHFDCPPRMDDGRHFTDYRPSCHREDLLKADNQISNSFNYRQFLQHNGKTIMDKSRAIACQKNGCRPCDAYGLGVEGFNNGTMLPEKYIQECNANACKIVLNNPSGIGLGRRFVTCMDDNGFPNTFPAPKPVNTCAHPIDRLQYYGGNLERQIAGKQVQRLAVPGAGVPLNGGDHRQSPVGRVVPSGQMTIVDPGATYGNPPAPMLSEHDPGHRVNM